MGNLKEVRDRISSVKSTQQITKAMKMVAAAKLRRAQDKITQMRPYAAKIKEMMQRLTASEQSDAAADTFTKEREVKRVLLVLVTGDKGLCGSFNSSVQKLLVKTIQEDYATQFEKGNLDIICIGKKGSEFLKSRGYELKSAYLDLFSDLTFDKVNDIASGILADFKAEKYDKVEVIFNQFKNAAVFIPTREQFLPMEGQKEEEMANAEAQSKEAQNDYILEPSGEEILEALIPRSLRINFFRYVLDSNAAEHGARMTAMTQATDNAEDLLKDLKIKYNKERQAAITNEILEIVSGANALAG